MKKLLIPCLCAALLLSALAGCGEAGTQATLEPLPGVSASAAPESPAAEYDWDALRETYGDDTVVLTVNGDEVRWDEFFYWFHTDYDRYFSGRSLDESIDGETTVGEYLAMNAASYCVQYHVLAQLEEEKGIELTAEDEEIIAEAQRSDIEEQIGEDGTLEDLYEYLDTIYITPELYDFMTRTMTLYPRMFIVLYGEEGAKLSDGETLETAERYGFMTVKHILFGTVDENGESLSEGEKEAQKTLAQDSLNELLAVPEAEREALFDEMMERYSTDPGLEAYPEGYCFAPGTMVTEFESAASALSPGGISSVVESANGYHILLRKSLTPEDSVLLSGLTEPVTLRYAAAEILLNELYTGAVAAAEAAYTEDFAEGSGWLERLSAS